MRTKSKKPKATAWQLRIQDPTGETRIVRLADSAILSTSVCASPHSDDLILLRDTHFDGELVLTRDPKNAIFWLRLCDGTPAVRLGDYFVREAIMPVGVPVCAGDTQIILEQPGTEQAQPDQPSGYRPWVSCSEAGNETLWLTKKAAATPLALYFAGETGTGKEVLAELAHAWSERASGPFVPLHCAALPLTLVESELFGHVKGAFTGAHQHRPGALFQAHGGTLFLDEIGDLPMDIQIKLLRFLENGEIRPVGSDRPSRVDVRLICATHKPLLNLVEQGKFRRDLYYRLASVTIPIPALRDRPEDIERLAMSFARDLRRTLSPQAVLRLQAHTWPGNVRELRHAIERAAGLSGPFVEHLNEASFDFLLNPANVGKPSEVELGSPILKLADMERLLILKALKIARGNRGKTARILGVARSTLFEMLRRHRIYGPRAYAAILEGRPEEKMEWKAAETG